MHLIITMENFIFIALWRLVIGLLLLLSGMKIMSTGLVRSNREKIKSYLSFISSDPKSGFLTGVFITAVLQSSSLTTVLVVGLAHTGILNLKTAIAIILGANVGTTITAQIIAFNIDQYGIFIAVLSLGLYLLSKRLQSIMLVSLGFGILLAGMNFINQGLSSQMITFYDYALNASEFSPVWGLLIGVFSAAVIQSSSAVTAFIISLAGNNGIDLTTSLSIIFGSDIGTCLTSLIASLSTNLSGRRVALTHLIFNVIKALIVLSILPYFTLLVMFTSDDISRQIANGHTLYNLSGGLFFLFFINLITKLICWLLPEKPHNSYPKMKEN